MPVSRTGDAETDSLAMVAFPAGDLNMQVLAANGSVFGEIHQPVGRLAGWPLGRLAQAPEHPM